MVWIRNPQPRLELTCEIRLEIPKQTDWPCSNHADYRVAEKGVNPNHYARSFYLHKTKQNEGNKVSNFNPPSSNSKQYRKRDINKNQTSNNIDAWSDIINSHKVIQTSPRRVYIPILLHRNAAENGG